MAGLEGVKERTQRLEVAADHAEPQDLGLSLGGHGGSIHAFVQTLIQGSEVFIELPADLCERHVADGPSTNAQVLWLQRPKTRKRTQGYFLGVSARDV
jgi:hypothetical protein